MLNTQRDFSPNHISEGDAIFIAGAVTRAVFSIALPVLVLGPHAAFSTIEGLDELGPAPPLDPTTASGGAFGPLSELGPLAVNLR